MTARRRRRFRAPRRRAYAPGVSYRDESEALRAKVQDLEGRLDDAEETIARLRGETAAAPAGEGEHSRLIGAQKRVVLERELPFEVSAEGYEAVAAVLRSRLAVTASQVGRRMTAGPFTMSYEGGVTRLRVVLDRQHRAAGLLAGASLLGGFGTLVSLGVIHDVLHGSPAHGLWILPIAVAACALPLRGLIRRSLFSEETRWRGAFEAMIDAATAHAVRAPSAQVRVEAVEDEPVEHEVEREVDRAGASTTARS